MTTCEQVLTDCELAAIQELVSVGMDKAVVIKSLGYTSDGAGGGTQTYNIVGTVYAQVTPYLYGDTEAVGRDNRIEESIPWTFTFPANTVINASDQLHWVGGIAEVIGSDFGKSLATDLNVVARQVK